MMEIEVFELDQLHAHPQNSNVMSEGLFKKLVSHIKETDRYPPVLVRALGEGYQILDGHHRVKALREIGCATARCVVWEVDDAEALLLLATLNRLQGQDDPRKRAGLLDLLSQHEGLKVLASKLPETREKLAKLLTLKDVAPSPRLPGELGEFPVPVHFFLMPSDKRTLDARLRELGGTREEGLMQLVEE